MKKTLALFAIPVIAISLLFSCGKTTTSLTNSFKATVGSNSFSAAVTTVTDSTSFYVLAGASSGGFPLLTVAVPNAVGTFSLGVATHYVASYLPSTSASAIVGTSGTITVTEVTPNISGTFSFVGTDSALHVTNVTNGTFSVKP